MIVTFAGPWLCFSNFYPVKIMHEGLLYPSVEHAYQASKTLDLELRTGIAQLQRAGTAKRIGRLLPLREDWEDVKVPTMRSLLRYKFPVHGSQLTNQLMISSSEELIEGNHWHDRFWGRCMCIHCDGVGENWLGRLLMERREFIWNACSV